MTFARAVAGAILWKRSAHQTTPIVGWLFTGKKKMKKKPESKAMQIMRKLNENLTKRQTGEIRPRTVGKRSNGHIQVSIVYSDEQERKFYEN